MYIAIVNIHGLIRSEEIEMGRDADTGGQTRYVIDLVKELASRDNISVDLFTRKIQDKRVSKDYGRDKEPLGEACRIIRLPCGGKKYIRKERLWPYLDEYVDAMIEFFRQEDRVPDIIHGHYADGGYIACEISDYFNTPLVFTGHSLGRIKFDFLESLGLTRERIEDHYAISTRIKQEERVLKKADLVITSTAFERDELYEPYQNRDLEKFSVIPPGMDLKKFFPYYHYEIQDPSITEEQKLAQYRMLNELRRFYSNPDRPIILALCRPEARKNIDVLIDIYGSSKELQTIANLAIVAGIREDINSMEEGEKQVLTDMLLLMDRYDLYGKMAIPKHHSPERDVPELYRLTAMKRGVFVSTASMENFGLTFIEASATGLPFIGTDRGGVQDIRKNCESGILVDIDDHQQVYQAILTLLTDGEQWNELSRRGIERIRLTYNWASHCDTYLHDLHQVLETREGNAKVSPYSKSMARRLSSVSRMLIADIDHTLTGDQESISELGELLEAHREELGFGIATGRHLDAAVEVLAEHGLPVPDVFIASVGTEIYYGKDYIYDKGWSNYIRRRWYPETIRKVLSEFSELELQNYEGSQRQFKISCFVDTQADTDALMQRIKEALDDAKCTYHLVLSHDRFLDVLPYRASKGSAVKYISWKWHIEPKSVITAGDSGNDRDMLSSPMRGIVVGNYEQSLEPLKKSKHVYFSQEPYAAGVIDGLRHYGVFPKK